MKSNLESLKFVRNTSSIELVIGIIGVDDTIHFYVDNAYMPLVLDCLRGTSNIYPTLCDGGYMMFTPKYLYYMRTSPYMEKGTNVKASGVYFDNWIYINGEWLYDLLNSFVTFGDDTNFVCSDSEIERMKYNNRSVSKFYWYDVHTLSNNVGLKESIRDLAKYTKSFRACLSTLKRIANNSSNGNPIIIQVSFDTASEKSKTYPDFYFTIMDGSNRVMNGGIIYHESTNKYQLHT